MSATITIEQSTRNIPVVSTTGQTVVVQQHEAPTIVVNQSSVGPQGAPGTSANWLQYRATGLSIELLAGQRTEINVASMPLTLANAPQAFIDHDFLSDLIFKPFGAIPGGRYDLRLNLNINHDIIDNKVNLELDIGGTEGIIDDDTITAFEQAGESERSSVLFTFYTFNTFLANGGRVFARARTDCTINSITALVTVWRTS